jgi:hypothetical protein
MHDQYLPNDSYIIADSGYALSKDVIVPYRQNEINGEREIQFNNILSIMRMAVEKAFGRLKSRWRILLRYIDCRNNDRIAKIIQVCCILHNICIDAGDIWDEMHDIVDENALERDNMRGGGENNGKTKRDWLARCLDNL